MTNREAFPQDRLGNENRRLDEYRARDGAFITVAGGDTGTDQIVYEFPDDVQEFHLTQIHYGDTSGTAATFHLKTATLTSGGAVDTSTQVTPDYNVGADADETFDVEMEAFTDDAIVVNTDSASEVRIGGFADAKEEHEVGSEQTTA